MWLTMHTFPQDKLRDGDIFRGGLAEGKGVGRVPRGAWEDEGPVAWAADQCQGMVFWMGETGS